MMESSLSGKLVGSDIHGFYTMQVGAAYIDVCDVGLKQILICGCCTVRQPCPSCVNDLDVPGIMKEAKSRWLRPNEIHAMLFNYNYFNINVKPVNLPKGGTIVLFDRKKLRNFRKDGHNWKKKKDGKTVKEAHEHLKVGTEERIHVYYAHGEDNPNFVRRCYWLLDKSLEHIVLVHYRETQELQGSPVTPANSDFTSDFSDPSASRLLSGENNYSAAKELIEARDSFKIQSHELRLHEINTLEWDELLASNPNEASLPAKENVLYSQQYSRHTMYNSEKNGTTLSTSECGANMIPCGNSFDPQGTGLSYNDQQGGTLPLMQGPIDRIMENQSFDVGTSCASGLLYGTVNNGSSVQDSLGTWMNEIMVDSPGSVDDNYVESSVASHGSFMPPGEGGPIPKQIFCITDISPTWAYSTEETKILVVGFFHQDYQHLAKSNIFCNFGDICVPAEIVQVGVFRCLVSPPSLGLVNLYLSIDGCTPISQTLTFEFRSLPSTITENRSQRDMFCIQMRLANLLFSTSKSIDILSSKVSPSALKEGKRFALKHSTADNWDYYTKMVENGEVPQERAKDSLVELSLKSKLNEWLLERIFDRSNVSERDSRGQGVLHLCSILDYTWAVYPYSSSGLSLDFRDKFGWTALHWAAYFGREKMVAALLSVGAKPNLVTDPTSENPGGCTAADVASKQGFEGLAAYLSEKALVQQFEDMKLAGNAAGSLDTPSNDNPITISEDEVYLKDTLTAYRTAADAAARIQVAFREHALKQKTMAVNVSNPENEARCIVAAMKIQHAFRSYESRKKMAAAARIQHRFKTWKFRKEFLNMRRQAIRIQAAFRGFQVRRQYCKILWSVGVLEKAVLRWRLKRKGLRGLKVEIDESVTLQRQDSDLNPEEDFYRASRKQAEQRVEKAVVRVQAMFRSRQAQQEYRRMKLAHRQAELEYEESTRSKLPP